MDDGDLWGEDDFDEALLIEASQQVEAETINKVSAFSNFVLNFSMGEKGISGNRRVYPNYIINFFIFIQARRSSFLPTGNETVKIDESELAILIQDVGEDNRKESDVNKSDDYAPKHDRFLQTQTIFQGVRL